MTQDPQEKYDAKAERYRERGFKMDMNYLEKGAKNTIKYYKKKMEKNPHGMDIPWAPNNLGQPGSPVHKNTAEQRDPARTGLSLKKLRGVTLGTDLYSRGRRYWGN